MIACNGEV